MEKRFERNKCIEICARLISLFKNRAKDILVHFQSVIIVQLVQMP